MSRTALYKAIYFAVLLGLPVLLLSVAWYFEAPILAPVALLFLLIPGRILGYFWRDLLCGLRLLNEKQFEESKVHSQKFIVEVRKKPWLKKLIWLGTSSYSRDPEVLALNNLGAAQLSLGEWDAARSYLREAIALDQKCPLPYYNMSVLSRAAGEHDEAERWLSDAAKLGYTLGWSDRVVSGSQARYARRDG